uniref:Uncharacterized protein n=1 Tax=Parascaris equorum TaxID=6256 RepID=A0A914RTX7_PAREQ
MSPQGGARSMEPSRYTAREVHLAGEKPLCAPDFLLAYSPFCSHSLPTPSLQLPYVPNATVR